jgi:hypothetical protein
VGVVARYSIGAIDNGNNVSSSQRAFVDTYGNFQEYMVGIKSNKRPAVAHRKSSSIIDIERDGTSSVVYAFTFYGLLMLFAFLLGRGTYNAN